MNIITVTRMAAIQTAAEGSIVRLSAQILGRDGLLAFRVGDDLMLRDFFGNEMLLRDFYATGSVLQGVGATGEVVDFGTFPSLDVGNWIAPVADGLEVFAIDQAHAGLTYAGQEAGMMVGLEGLGQGGDLGGAGLGGAGMAGIASAAGLGTLGAASAGGGSSAPKTSTGADDTAAPEAPTLDPVTGNGLLISGSAEAGATVSVDMGGVTRSVTAGVDGSWSVDFSDAGLADGTQAVAAIATDAAGNTSATATASVTVDTAAPEALVIQSQSILAISGTGEPGATVTVTNETSGAMDFAQVRLDGTWSVIYAIAPTAGDSIIAVQCDPAGNESNPVSAPTPPSAGWLAGVETLTYDRPALLLGDEHFEGTIPEYQAGMSLQVEIVDARGLGGAVDFDTQINADGSFVISGRDGLLSDVIDGAIGTLGLDAGDTISFALTVVAADGAESPAGLFLLRDPQGIFGGLGDLLGGEVLGISRDVPLTGQRYSGTEAADHLAGRDGFVDVLHGLGGDDLLLGIGAGDTILAGAGDDSLFGLAGFAVVDGGAGSDRLAINGDLSLTAGGADVVGIEALDLSEDTGANSLTVDSDGLVGLGDLAAALTVLGDANDTVVLANGFTSTGTRRDGEAGSQICYTDSASNSLWIDEDITVSVMSG